MQGALAKKMCSASLPKNNGCAKNGCAKNLAFVVQSAHADGKGLCKGNICFLHPNRKFWSVLERGDSKKAKERACLGSNPGPWVPPKRKKRHRCSSLMTIKIMLLAGHVHVHVIPFPQLFKGQTSHTQLPLCYLDKTY